MSDVLLAFAGIGIFILQFLVVLGVTGFLSWVWNDTDHTGVWIVVTLCYALTNTIIIMQYIS